MAGPGASGSRGSLRKPCWGLLILLSVLCFGLYILLYYRASLSTSPTFLFAASSSSHPARSGGTTTLIDPAPSITASESKQGGNHSQAHPTRSSGQAETHSATSNSSSNSSSNKTKGGDERAAPVLTLFSTWVERDDQSVVRNLTLRNWAQLRPAVLPVLFTNSSRLAAVARQHGWETLPVSRTAVSVPVLKYMYMDAMQRFNSSLYAFANGDLLFTDSLVKSLQVILADPSLPLQQKPVFIVGQRTNVAMVTPEEASSFQRIVAVSKARGKLFTTMAEDFFIADRKFPWDSIPGVVIGRRAYDNWLVLHAIQSGHVVIDVTKTALAVHQTTKVGNYEGFSHANSEYNANVLTRLYKKIHYMGGCVDCAPWQTLSSSDDTIHVQKKSTRPKHC